MVEVKQLLSFKVPRNPAVSSPLLREALLFKESGYFPELRDFSDFFSSSGNRILWSEPLPVRFAGARKGRLFSLRDGLIFVPNTLKGQYADLHRDVITPVHKAVSVMAGSIDLKAAGAPPDVGEPPNTEWIDPVFDWLEPDAADPPDDNPTFWSLREKGMHLRGTRYLPFSDLVEVAMWETRPRGLIEPFTYEGGIHSGLTFEAEDGTRATYYVTSTWQDDRGNILGSDAAKDDKRYRKGGELSPDELTALIFMKLRFRRELGYFARQIEDEHFPPGFRARLVAEYARAGTAQWMDAENKMHKALLQENGRHGFPGRNQAEILRRFGETAAYFRALPYERHGYANIIAELEAGDAFIPS